MSARAAIAILTVAACSRSHGSDEVAAVEPAGVEADWITLSLAPMPGALRVPAGTSAAPDRAGVEITLPDGKHLSAVPRTDRSPRDPKAITDLMRGLDAGVASVRHGPTWFVAAADDHGELSVLCESWAVAPGVSIATDENVDHGALDTLVRICASLAPR